MPHEHIASALAAAQSSMGHALKDSRNPHFRSEFASLQSVVDAVRPHLSEQGIAVVQMPSYDGERVSVTTLLLWRDQELESTISAKPTKSDPQGIGSAVTYLRRYGLMAITGIAPADDDGNASSARQNGSGSRPSNSSGSAQGRRAERHQPAPVDLDRPHHPSFADARTSFMGQLKARGIDYATIKRWCAANGKLRPSQVDQGTRDAMFKFFTSEAGRNQLAQFEE